MIRHSFVFATLFLSYCVSSASAQVSISDGTSSYFWDPNAPQSTTFVDQFAGNIMFEDMWIVRYSEQSQLGGSTTFTAQLNANASGPGVNYLGTVNNGASAVSTWNIQNVGGLGGNQTLFTVALTHTISTDANGNAQLTHAMEIFNFLDGPELADGSDLDVFLFQDFDIPDFGTNSATASTQNGNQVIEMESNLGHHAVTVGEDAFAHQLRVVGGGTRLSDAILNGEIVDLDNSGGPLFNVDINSMFQWDLSVVVGGTQSFGVYSLANELGQQIPEPTSVGLLALAGLFGLSRRRRK